MSEERMRILEMVADGTISSEQAAVLIQALDESAEVYEEELAVEEGQSADAGEETVEAVPEPETEEVPLEPIETYKAEEPYEAPEMPANLRKYKSFWYIPLAIGVVITAVSGLLVYAGNQGAWHWFWMTCVWVPLLLGIIIMMFSAMSRTARWVHVRVNTGQDEWPRRIVISMPLPLRTAAWAMKYFGKFIPGLDQVPIPVDEAITALKDSLTPDDPLYVHVEDAGGEEVEVYIG